MRRDWDLIRQILLKVEALEGAQQVVRAGSLPDWSSEVVSFHMFLLKEAGLIVASCSSPISGARSCQAKELTWEGYEFLDKIRSESAWNKTVGFVREKGVELTFDTIKASAGALALSLIGLK